MLVEVFIDSSSRFKLLRNTTRWVAIQRSQNFAALRKVVGDIHTLCDSTNKVISSIQNDLAN